MSAAKPGYFFLVVGPSGAGKDSLMDGARARLSPDQYVFAKRTVTRPPGMVGEDYQSCNPEAFAKRAANGEFLATWQAHGYQYGLPRTLAIEQGKGKHIIANGSRSMVSEISKIVPNLIVIHITAPIDVLAKRLARRGRETEAEIRERLNRTTDTFPDALTVMTISNDASLEDGIMRFVSAIKSVTQQAG